MITKFDISFGTREGASKQASKKHPPNIPTLNNPFEKKGWDFQIHPCFLKILGMTFGKSFGGAAGGCLFLSAAMTYPPEV